MFGILLSGQAFAIDADHRFRVPRTGVSPVSASMHAAACSVRTAATANAREL